MDLPPRDALLEIAKLLLAQDDDRAPELLLRRVLTATGATRGFIVIRERGGFAQRFHVRFDGESLSREERRFSRGIVKQVIQTGELIHAADVGTDPRFAGNQSVRWMGGASVLAVPLVHEGQVQGVVYLEGEDGMRVFSAECRSFVTEFTELAGLFLRRALEREELRRKTQELERDLFAKYDFQGFITADAGMRSLLQTLAQVAESEATVLVHGETGTGKELVARAIHANSPRRDHPFVTLHCTALTESVLESELFGHVKGAFTGAVGDRAGRLASAEGGTVFLDEIGELPATVQAKLLRFLQFGEIQRLGADRVERVDVRVVSATHRDLKELVREGAFREDLLYRLKVVEMEVPPLRHRRSDVALLAAHFAERFYRRSDGPARLSPELLTRLEQYPFPGNVRELEHVIERACVLARGPVLGEDLLPRELTVDEAPLVSQPELTSDGLKAARDQAVAKVESDFLDRLLAAHNGNVSQAARASGINRTHLQRMLARRR